MLDGTSVERIAVTSGSTLREVITMFASSAVSYCTLPLLQCTSGSHRHSPSFEKSLDLCSAKSVAGNKGDPSLPCDTYKTNGLHEATAGSMEEPFPLLLNACVMLASSMRPFVIAYPRQYVRRRVGQGHNTDLVNVYSLWLIGSQDPFE